MQHEVKMSMVA